MQVHLKRRNRACYSEQQQQSVKEFHLEMQASRRSSLSRKSGMSEAKRSEKEERNVAALLHFLIELLSGQVNLHSTSVSCLLPRQINIDSVLFAFSSCSSARREDGYHSWTRQQASSSLKRKNEEKKKGQGKGEGEGAQSLLSFSRRIIDQAPETLSLFTTQSEIHKTSPAHSAHSKSRKS